MPRKREEKKIINKERQNVWLDTSQTKKQLKSIRKKWHYAKSSFVLLLP